MTLVDSQPETCPGRRCSVVAVRRASAKVRDLGDTAQNEGALRQDFACPKGWGTSLDGASKSGLLPSKPLLRFRTKGFLVQANVASAAHNWGQSSRVIHRNGGQGATPMAPNFQPWITRIAPNCGQLGCWAVSPVCAGGPATGPPSIRGLSSSAAAVEL
jgi:hypothetical protein